MNRLRIEHWEKQLEFSERAVEVARRMLEQLMEEPYEDILSADSK